jgi:hypothetical protein
MEKKVQQTQAFLSSQTTSDGFALGSSSLDRLAGPGYDTKYDTNPGPLGSE